MELYIFARFYARDGQGEDVAAAIHDVVTASRREPGCRAIDGYRSMRDPLLLYIHSRWWMRRRSIATRRYRTPFVSWNG